MLNAIRRFSTHSLNSAPISKKTTTDNDDLSTLDNLTEDTLLAALKNRHASGQIYTNIGNILLAVNPYRVIPELVSEDAAKRYEKPGGMPKPHIYETALKAYQAMRIEGSPQVRQREEPAQHTSMVVVAARSAS
eukprot:m.248320 g.248320  ORF g.248320 m.248320 type:complete len:134 (-) comp19075_c0_seq16:1060-1461(-)